jgi:DNA-binding LytR/AlgR family response regulator
MLRIAICDDLPDQLAAIAEFINEYIASNDLDAELRQFAHPDALLTTCETVKFHIYILDIVMPMVNGIEVGRAIRRLDREAQIIFATTEPSFALESFQANPINYLIKPIDKARFFQTLDLAVSKVNTEDEPIVTLKTRDGLNVIKLSSIIFCEYTNHFVQYTLMGEEILTTRSLQESFADHIKPLLSDKRFLQPHTSFVLNMNRVEAFSKNGFVMRGGAVIPIPAKQYAMVRDTYMDYLLAREGCE